MHDPRPTGRSARVRRRITEQAAHWYLDLREGLDTERRAAFLAWLKASPDHVAEYLAITQLHGDLKPAASMETLSVEELGELAAAEHAVVPLYRSAPVRSERPAMAPRRRRSRWFALAGIAMVALAGAAAWQQSTYRNTNVYASAPDQGRSFDLSDGSLVQLDRDSAIAVRFDARHRDFELLRGTAMINVGKDPARPLRMTLGANVLRDVGTVFEATRRADGGSITVVSGRIDLLAPRRRGWSVDHWLHGRDRSGRVVTAIRRGEQATVDGQGRLVTFAAHADIARATAWLPDEIRFRQSTVAEVARHFNAYTTCPLLIENPTLAAVRISGRFHAHDMAAFVAYLGSFPGVRVQRGSDAIRILDERDASPKSAQL